MLSKKCFEDFIVGKTMRKRDKSASTLPASEHLDYIDDKTAALLLSTPKSARVLLWVIIAFLVVTAVWASFAELDKVTVGQGKVILNSPFLCH